MYVCMYIYIYIYICVYMYRLTGPNESVINEGLGLRVQGLGFSV